MMGSTFLSNSAQYCGALGLNSKHTNILESNFIWNSAVIDGGAICTYPGVSDITISTGNFSYNHANRNGGVLVTQPLQNGVKPYLWQLIHPLILTTTQRVHKVASLQCLFEVNSR